MKQDDTLMFIFMLIIFVISTFAIMILEKSTGTSLNGINTQETGKMMCGHKGYEYKMWSTNEKGALIITCKENKTKSLEDGYLKIE